MIDLRIKTFLHLCDSKSYTKTARALFITQPTVTQHIQFLEKHFGKKLLSYNGKSLALTSNGEIFRAFCLALNANSQSFEEQFCKTQEKSQLISFGATKTIGEFFLPPLLCNFAKGLEDYHLDIHVENTQMLLNMLEKAEISFAMLEGFFDKTKYDWLALKKEEFVCVVSSKDTLAANSNFDDILSRPLFLREEGSGTREIAIDIIKEHGFSLENFAQINKLGSFALIKPLVYELCGVSFGYLPAFAEEISSGRLVRLAFGEEKKYRSFNIVRLKNQLNSSAFEAFYNFCLSN